MAPKLIKKMLKNQMPAKMVQQKGKKTKQTLKKKRPTKPILQR